MISSRDSFIIPATVIQKILAPFHGSSRLEQGFHLCFCRLSGILSFAADLGISKNEEITKIAPILFNNPLCLRFTAIVIGPDMMVSAIEAAVQVRSAKGTALPPAHGKLYFKKFQAFIAALHSSFFRRIMKVRTAGAIRPKMLNQRGT